MTGPAQGDMVHSTLTASFLKLEFRFQYKSAKHHLSELSVFQEWVRGGTDDNL